MCHFDKSHTRIHTKQEFINIEEKQYSEDEFVLTEPKLLHKVLQDISRHFMLLLQNIERIVPVLPKFVIIIAFLHL